MFESFWMTTGGQLMLGFLILSLAFIIVAIAVGIKFGLSRRRLKRKTSNKDIFSLHSTQYKKASSNAELPKEEIRSFNSNVDQLCGQQEPQSYYNSDSITINDYHQFPKMQVNSIPFIPVMVSQQCKIYDAKQPITKMVTIRTPQLPQPERKHNATILSGSEAMISTQTV